ncbi:MAG: hypothetical protein LBR20_06635 [Propionibacteriaceae bacterium]|jgi:hypothetical protein|nr:hypothetical protein [Propionibacteriaceae bacterium]
MSDLPEADVYASTLITITRDETTVARSPILADVTVLAAADPRIGEIQDTSKQEAWLRGMSANDLRAMLGEPTWLDQCPKTPIEWAVRFGEEMYTICTWKEVADPTLWPNSTYNWQVRHRAGDPTLDQFLGLMQTAKENLPSQSPRPETAEEFFLHYSEPGLSF